MSMMSDIPTTSPKNHFIGESGLHHTLELAIDAITFVQLARHPEGTERENANIRAGRELILNQVTEALEYGRQMVIEKIAGIDKAYEAAKVDEARKAIQQIGADMRNSPKNSRKRPRTGARYE